MANTLIQDFAKPADPDDSAPHAELRNFNVHDILGELDRDERGNVVVLQDSFGNKIDKNRMYTNIRGYLLEQETGDIVDNKTSEPMFNLRDLDDKGEVPAPFCIEKYNFNPHDLMGDLDFQYDQGTGRAIPQLRKTKQGFNVDKKGRRVNRYGWLVQGGNVHIVDKKGRKRFDRRQLEDGDIPKLLNYSGRRFDIKDVMGIFNWDKNQKIIIRNNENIGLIDNVGRRVNEKGYLTDQVGNIVDRGGRLMFVKEHLKNGEFPKFFLFTKFNIDNISGDYEKSPLSEPILSKDNNGNFVDL